MSVKDNTVCNVILQYLTQILKCKIYFNRESKQRVKINTNMYYVRQHISFSTFHLNHGRGSKQKIKNKMSAAGAAQSPGASSGTDWNFKNIARVSFVIFARAEV